MKLRITDRETCTLQLNTDKFVVRYDVDHSNCGLVHIHYPERPDRSVTYEDHHAALFNFLRKADFEYLYATDEAARIRDLYAADYGTTSGQRSVARMSACVGEGTAWMFYCWLRKNHPNRVRATDTLVNENSENRIFVFIIALEDEFEFMSIEEAEDDAD